MATSKLTADSFRRISLKTGSREDDLQRRTHPFELGPVSRRDRMYVDVDVRKWDQGPLLNVESGPLLLHVDEAFNPLPLADLAGGVFARIRQLISSQQVQKQIQPWSMVGFMSGSMSPNGLAGVVPETHGQRHFISVTLGAYAVPLLAAFDFMSSPSFDSGMGASDSRLVKFPGIGRGEFLISLDPERRNKAAQFASAALMVTFFHELAHVLRGHIAFYSQAYGASHIPELGQTAEAGNIASPDDMLRRAIELDADECAGCFMAKAFFMDRGINRASPDYEARSFRVTVGAALLFSWLAKSSQYHSGPVRAFVFLSALFNQLESSAKEARRYVVDVLQKVQHIFVENGLLSSKQVELDLDELQDAISTTMALRASRQKEWLALRPWNE